MQKPHSSTGNALAIIQHSKLLSPQDRLLLQEGCEHFTNWREIFSQDIYPDLHTIFEVLEPLIELFEESARKGTLPEYGQAVNVVLRGAYEKFHAWRCFQGWGEQSVELYRNPLLLLPLVQTDAAIRKSDCIGTISRFTRRSVLSLVEWRTLFEELSRFGHSHTLCFINSTVNTSKYVKREIHLSCMGFTDNYVDIESRIINR